ncbi:unnamed protein product [Echinostoma caproni]|uniref:DUF4515 domain-containing protein n=1 Tax=Echinostoma caproni TaxID=27848 RepID=A0A183A7V3_9TREM|nr:unnamed protein product [Echinostoma caproni]
MQVNDNHPPNRADFTDGPKPPTVSPPVDLPDVQTTVPGSGDNPLNEAYSRQSANKRARAQELERHLQETQDAHFELAQRAQEARKQVLNRVTQEDAQFSVDLAAVQQRRDLERAAFMSGLLDAEQRASRLVQELLDEQTKAHATEVADDLASRRLLDRPDASFKLRREEMLAAMEHLLEQEYKLYHGQVLQRDSLVQHTLVLDTSDSEHVNQVLARRLADRQKLSQELASKEEAQRDAFAKLLAQQDSQAQRLRREIGLIEQELCRLTMAEQDRKAKRTEINQRTLTERRMELLDLLLQLSKDQRRRQNELQQRLMEMEKRKQQDQMDYWLIQYQRLLDNKPPQLDMECLVGQTFESEAPAPGSQRKTPSSVWVTAKYAVP